VLKEIGTDRNYFAVEWNCVANVKLIRAQLPSDCNS